MRLAWCCALAMAGCFADAPDIAESSTGGMDCPVGSKGCPCTNGGSCDGQLECHAESQRCFDPSCNPGSLNCPCADGLCLEGLDCVDDLCGAFGGSTDGSASSASTTVSTTAPTTADDGSDSTTGYTTTVDDGTATMTNDSTVTATTTDPTASSTVDDDGGAPTCQECVLMQMASCMTAYTNCVNAGGCAAALTCIEQGNALETCCGVAGADVATWNTFLSCAIEHCDLVCDGLIPLCPVKA